MNISAKHIEAVNRGLCDAVARELSGPADGTVLDARLSMSEAAIRAFLSSLAPDEILTREGVRKVLGTLPITADGCIVGDVPDHGALLFYRERNGTTTPYRVTLCSRCIADPDDESKDWNVIENDELNGKGLWYSSRDAALAARERTDGR